MDKDGSLNLKTPDCIFQTRIKEIIEKSNTFPLSELAEHHKEKSGCFSCAVESLLIVANWISEVSHMNCSEIPSTNLGEFLTSRYRCWNGIVQYFEKYSKKELIEDSVEEGKEESSDNAIKEINEFIEQVQVFRTSSNLIEVANIFPERFPDFVNSGMYSPKNLLEHWKNCSQCQEQFLIDLDKGFSIPQGNELHKQISSKWNLYNEICSSTISI